MNARLETTHPATQSLVPLMNLVMLWTTTSAPWRNGESTIGLNVLSTTSAAAVLMGDRGEARDVRDLEERIADAIRVEHARPRL